MLTGIQNTPCRRPSNYLVTFGANIAVPTGGTVGDISLAITIDGTTIPASQMIVTPAAVDEFWNVACSVNAARARPFGIFPISRFSCRMPTSYLLDEGGMIS